MAKDKEYAVRVSYPYDQHDDDIIAMSSKKEAKSYIKIRGEGYFLRMSVVSRPVIQDWEVEVPSEYQE